MNVKKISPTICVNDPAASRDFYIKHFDAEAVFDAGWYVNVRIGMCELCFMKPQDSEQPFFTGGGLMYNLEVEDVDGEHQRLSAFGLKPVMPLEDHPWGDRGFSVIDPNGVVLYIYTPTEPSPEFKQYYK